MILSLFCAWASLSLPGERWFGPAAVHFLVPYEGNPYDPDTNDVEVRFSSGGHTETRLAYFDGKLWTAVLLAHQPGVYKATVVVNGRVASHIPGSVSVRNAMKAGFVRLDKAHERFKLSDGTPFFPIGHDLGWGSPKIDLSKQLVHMGQNGVDWSRIWACPWDGKNPFFPPDHKKIPMGWMDTRAFAKWDPIVAAADKAGIRFQWVLFHHGLFSSTTDPNWQDHPWNTKNGGFLANPSDFFTDPTAIKFAKEWLRYAVARYGHEPSVMAWELFNEVQWVNAVHDHRRPTSAAGTKRWPPTSGRSIPTTIS